MWKSSSIASIYAYSDGGNPAVLQVYMHIQMVEIQQYCKLRCIVRWLKSSSIASIYAYSDGGNPAVLQIRMIG